MQYGGLIFELINWRRKKKKTLEHAIQKCLDALRFQYSCKINMQLPSLHIQFHFQFIFGFYVYNSALVYIWLTN